MRKYEERIKRYEKKLDIYFPNRLKEKMVKNYQKEAKILAEIDGLVSKILNDYQIPTEYISYYSFARELYGLKRRYISKRLEKETGVCFHKWLMRGLEKKVMLKIKKEMGRLPLGE
ncbi:MAG: hypothetical protein ABIK78_00555 [candidate division WOR-3 bacterium]